ncbi:MAG: efflux RND transporter permease subunit [Candidatus Peribacter sp.]|jgi:copper/silver efflux system protein|nr:efflux RND transporter permease subunit [Candidatus Peribacter sp.]MBT7337131.1 efflux RND transporter permease subunit [Candidatus Peregrinibacteria bacterium]MBT4392860.1 efflux RND transporter permease subunit [Candidatus Peribacter sp.]MBT4601344.1 efflux RND transporter permease subunit [Candidatus Peribacter sp.]MBT5149404.1 efflux RND transporter permease subunit [Candidatus Peribacter sp.]
MINYLITKALENRFITLLSFAVIAIGGVVTMMHTPVDAIPDLSENQVIIMTEWTGQTPRNIEDQITYPLTVSMQGLAGVRDIRASSMLGVSMVTVIFHDNIDIYFARDRVSERLSLVQAQLPLGVTPILGPDATGVGHIFMYTLESDTHTLTELRSLQDFVVRYSLQSVPGVAEVASVGGYKKTYEVILNPQKLQQFNLRITQVMDAIRMANNNVSGKVIDTGGREVAIQGIGFFEKIEEIGSTVVGKRSDGMALTVTDIGEVRESGMFRRAILANEEKEKVGGVVVMRYGENPLKVIDAVKERIKTLEESLPDGVTIKPFYDRTDLILSAIATLRSVLTQELIITTVILGLFLWHMGSTAITAIALIMGVLMTFIFMRLFGIPSNIMSLGGIAIAIGTMVDAAIVISENAYRKLLENPPKTLADRVARIKEATLEVGKPIVFAIFIIILSFAPIFTLTGQEGKLFTPLAYTNLFAMLGALIAALFLVPTLSVFFLKGKLRNDDEIPIVQWLQNKYKPILLLALARRRLTLGIAGALAVIGFGAMTQIGSEFMPPLDEGTLWYMPISLPDVSEERAQELLIATNKIISEIPEVQMVVGKAGRADTATDPAPLAMFETFITLKPKSEWRRGMTKEKIIREMNTNIQFDNLWNSFTQPIIGRIDMLSTGIRTTLGVKFFGDDPVKLEALAIEAEAILSGVLGAADTVAIRTTGLRYLDIDLKDDLLAQHSIMKMDALKTIAAGVGGAMITKTIEGREQYGVQVRLQQAFRQDVEDIKSLPLQGMNGERVLLSSVADIKMTDGPAVIHSENGILRSVVQTNVRGIDMASFVKKADARLESELTLPQGYSYEWAGQYENQLRAKQRLSIVIPLVLFVIFLLLYLTYKDLSLVSIVMLTIPLSLVGGVIALFIADFNFSVAVWVGFIALFGNAVETGTVIVVYLENAFKERFANAAITKAGIHEAVVSGSLLRLRPILMTAFTSVIGLIPMIASTGTGAEVSRPLALVVMSGLTTSVLLTLIVLPVLFAMLRERQL